MNLPILYIILPSFIAVASLIIRKKELVYRLLLIVLTFALGVGAIFLSLRAGNTGSTLSANEQFIVLGRSLNVTYTDLPLVGMIYLVTAGWLVAAFFYFPHEFFPAFCVIYTAFIIASISIDPFLYSVLIIFLANAIFLPVLSSGFYGHINGRMRFLTFQLLSVFLILLAGWILAGGEIAPVEEDQLFISFILLASGIALWLGVFPFHTWIPLLAEESSFYPLGFMLTLLPVSGILMLMKFLNNFAWLREYSAFFPAMQYLGAVMIFLGGVGAFFQKTTARMTAYVFISGIGMLLCGVGFIPIVSTDLVSAWLIPIMVGFWSISLGMHELVGAAAEQNIECLSGKFAEKPLHALLLVGGLFSVTGFPFTSGFAPNLLLLRTASNSTQVLLFFIVGGEIFLAMTCIRVILRLTLRSDKKFELPDKISVDRILIVFAILLNTFQGMFPSVLWKMISNAMSRIFPLI